MTERKNVKLRPGFTQVVVWCATSLLSENAEEFEEWVKRLGTRCQFLEVITSYPPGCARLGRDDIFFAIYERDVMGFIPQCSKYNMRWLDDIGRSEPIMRLWPDRIQGYLSWNADLDGEPIEDQDWDSDEGPEDPEGSNFGQALEALKYGKRVTRAGWNGKGMWLTLIRGSTPRDSREVADCIGMKTVEGIMQPGWLASQADMLAEDWEIL